MEEPTRRPVNPHRRRKTQMEIIKEAYLPTVILIVTIILIIVFIAGSLSRRGSGQDASSPPDTAPSDTAPSVDPYAAEVQRLLAGAAALAADYDYPSAVNLLDSFPGDITRYPELSAKRSEYAQIAANLVTWADPTQIASLSFHTLIADPARAFADDEYGTAYNRNFVTTGEFSNILQQLYDNGYVLVSLEDVTSCTTGEDGHTVCEARPLQLPAGKKPLLLVQTNVNYYTYMVDGNGDGEADKDGAGFASRLTVGTDGKVTSLMVDAAGNTVTGNYDLVPILNSFLEKHPDFSYRGARAVLAVSGYDGIFGYRTDAAARAEKGEEYYAGQAAGASAVVHALREDGYKLACYTYGNSSYGNVSASEIQTELRSWAEEVTPILGETNILVFAQNSELEDYSGSKFNVLQNAGLRYYFGFGSTGGTVGSDYILLKRLTVTGSQIAHTSLFDTFFDGSAILDPQRGEIPQ